MRPYAFYVVAIALVVVLIDFVAAMGIFSRLFGSANEVIALSTSLFAVVGTLVGAYFGIKVSSDTTDKTRGAIERANDTVNRALAALPPEEGKRITGPPAGPSKR